MRSSNFPSSSAHSAHPGQSPMLLGIDFDNTIVCYDALFHRVCRERGLIPAEVPINKTDVRNYLHQAGREDAWTEMQGYVYGAQMSEASPFPESWISFVPAGRLPCPAGSSATRRAGLF